MNTTIFYDSDGNITRVNRQEVALVIPENQLFLIDNSYVSPSEVDWRSKKIEGGKVVDRSDYVIDITDSQRHFRNTLLSETDWTQVADSPFTDTKKAEWVTYRQALRDLTKHANWPNLEESDWPEPPS